MVLVLLLVIARGRCPIISHANRAEGKRLVQSQSPFSYCSNPKKSTNLFLINKTTKNEERKNHLLNQQLLGHTTPALFQQEHTLH